MPDVPANLFFRWRPRTGSSGLVEAPLEEALFGGSGLCSPKQRYSLQSLHSVALKGPSICLQKLCPSLYPGFP